MYLVLPVAKFVAEGYGADYVLDITGNVLLPGVRALPLDGVPMVSFHALTFGNRSPMADVFIEEAEKVIAALRTAPFIEPVNGFIRIINEAFDGKPLIMRT